MDRQNVIDIHIQGSHALDSWWQESTGQTKGDLEKISGAKFAVDRKHWRSSVAVLCVIPHEEDYVSVWSINIY